MPTASLIKSPVATGYQSILDVFLLQGLINYQDYQSIKNKYTSNSEIENYLVKNKLISLDSINRAYSIIYKMPFVDLKHYQIPDEIKKIVPANFIRSNLIAPFAITHGILSVAIAQPKQINVQIPLIETQFREKVKSVNLFITSVGDIDGILNQYEGKSEDLLLSKTKYPTVYLKNQNISKELLLLLPPDFMVEHHLVIFGKRDDFNLMIATDRVDNPETLKAIKSVEDQNNLYFEIFATSSDDISFILNMVGSVKAAPPSKAPPSGAQSKIDSQESIKTGPALPIFQNIKEIISPSTNNGQITVDAVHKNDQPLFPVKKEPSPKTKEATEKDLTTENSTQADQADVEKIKQAMAPTETTESPIKPSPTDLTSEVTENIGQLLDQDITDIKEVDQIIGGGQVPKIVAALISYALSLRASDIHLEPEEKDFRVRFRVDGILQDVASLPKAIQPQIASRVKILSNLKLDESRIPQDGRFDVHFKQRQVDIRVSTLPTVQGEKIVLRLLDKSQGILSLEDLGMVGRSFNMTMEALKKPYGIIISTGPTGSGKTTTLYAVLNRISVPAVNIVTLEDPVEYEIPGINQCQIKPKIGFTFADGLRSILRQDPNVIMVGEVRDLETANMATHAALTGHLVLTTLHTNDAAGALPRLTNMGVEPFLITSSINLIIGQRLVRRICPKCREEIKVPESLRKQIDVEIAQIPKIDKDDLSRIKEPYKFFQGRGCQECSQGYRGRLGIFEVLSVSDKLEELVIGKASSSEILNQAISEGMITMRQDGILKAMEGLTTIDEVFRVTAAI